MGQANPFKEENWKLILVTFGIYDPLEIVVKIRTKFDQWIFTGMIVFYFCASFSGC